MRPRQRHSLAAAGLAAAAAAALMVPAAAAANQPNRVFEAPLSAAAGNPSAVPETAIVVGIQNYDHVSGLTNTVNDAKAISAMLKDFGYNVYEGYDLDKRGFETLLRQAALNIRDGGQVFFYYAGHGIQLGRRNYLLTRDAELTDIHDLPFQAVTLDRISLILGGKAGSQILMLDSCRDNPVPNVKLTAEIGAELYEAREGFDVFRPPLNTLVAFSTSPGATALDGEPGGNSPYTSAVVKQFPARPEEDAMTVLAAIRSDVYSSTENQQVPWESSTLTAKVYLRPQEVPGTLTAAAQPEPSTPEPQAVLANLPGTLTIAAPLGRALELAPEIEPYLPPDTKVSILTRPSNGTSVLSGSSGTDFSLSYAPQLTELPARKAQQSPRQDSMTIRIAQGGSVRDVQLDLEMSASQCDKEAGDLLDLQGVGLYRFPNEIDVKAAEAACQEAVQSAPDIGRFHYQLGRALQGQGRLEESYAAFASAAELGHIRAYNALAYLHDTPNIDRAVVDIPLDPAIAEDWWQKGIDAGDPFSMHSLGKRLLRNSETEQGRQQGFDLLSRALELGHTYSMNELGAFFLWRGEDLSQPERGLSYLQASADRGDIYGTANLGYVYRDGLAGMAQDREKAKSLFAEASQLGHPTAPAEIGRMIMRGELPGSDAAEALEWYDMGLSRGDAWGGTNGAWVALNRLQDRVPAYAAAARAGKALALGGEDARNAARELLAGMSAADIAAGAQYILQDLGADVTVDGQFGPASQKALKAMQARAGLPDRASGSAVDQLQAAAQVHFAFNPIRQDLF